MAAGTTERLRLVEMLAPLSYVTDLGMGEREGLALRSTLLCVRLGGLLGLAESELADCYYTALLRHIGCTATAHEESAFLLPDEIAVRAAISRTDVTKPKEALALTRKMLNEVPLTARPKLLTHMMRPGDWGRTVERSLCEVAMAAARRLGLGAAVERGLYDVRERWDGKGEPGRLRGSMISLPARVAQACGQLASLSAAVGVEQACSAMKRRAGGWLDPDIAGPLSKNGPNLLAEIDQLDLMEAVVAAEPGLARMVTGIEVDQVARVFADLADLKMPWTHGHSSAVAAIAEQAAVLMRLSESELVSVRRAGLLHDLGRAGVPNSVWEKPGPLGSLEWERVRMHAYHSERILSRSPVFAPIARIAGMHHERQDGSGYHRQAAGAAIPPAARLLAAADVYQAMLQDRPYRPAWPPDRAEAELRKMSAAGQLDAEAVSAVLTAAGNTGAIRVIKAWPAGLTDREVEVLRLVARGLSNRAIGAALNISPRTAEHHVQNVYTKTGFSTRAAAAMFAMEHGLITPGA